MSKSAMLRTRRRDVNVKPNRRLDRKSSRGMIYENEELRLRTININAEIERGQSDIKKLRRENEQLRKEIWCLRDEYDKLDKLLKEKINTSCSSCSSESNSCSSCSETEDNEETSQNLENVQKTNNLHNLQTEFDHLSVVTEENSAEIENSDINSQEFPNSPVKKESQTQNWDALPPDMSYPNFETERNDMGTNFGAKHFFSPIKNYQQTGQSPWSDLQSNFTSFQQPTFPFEVQTPITGSPLMICPKTSPDLIVQPNYIETESSNQLDNFSNGQNLDELLQDIETISNDILQISNQQNSGTNLENNNYKSELNVVLLPKPMPLIGFEKYDNLKSSFDSLDTLKQSNDNLTLPLQFNRQISNPFFANFDKFDSFDNSDNNTQLPNLINDCNESKNEKNQQENNNEKSSEAAPLTIDSEIVKNDSQTTSDNEKRRSRKISIYFKGKKDKLSRSLSLDTNLKNSKDNINHLPPTPQTSTSTILPTPSDKKSHNSKNNLLTSHEVSDSVSDSKLSNYDTKIEKKHHTKSSSSSPERGKHVHVKLDETSKKCHKKKHKKSERRLPNRRQSLAVEKFREQQRSMSVCTDRSNILDQKYSHYDDFYTTSERDRSNSLSSCETIKSRKMSQLPPLQVGGKIPWFACWGNGCL